MAQKNQQTKKSGQNGARSSGKQTPNLLEAVVADGRNSGRDTAGNTVRATWEAAESSLKNGERVTTQAYDQVVSAAGEQFGKGAPDAANRFGQYAGYQNENIQAFFNAGAIAANGMKALSEQMLACQQAAFDATVEGTRRFMGVTTAQELLQAQGEFAADVFGRFVAESGKLSELTVKVANETWEPLQARFRGTVDVFSISRTG